MPPTYLTPEYFRNITVGCTIVPTLLCPHCRGILHVGEKPVGPAAKRARKRGPKEGASPPAPTPPAPDDGEPASK